MIFNIYDASLTKVVSTEQNFNDLAKFITHNRSGIVINENLRSLFKEDKLSISPIGKLYAEFKELLLEKYNILSLIHIDSGISGVPQLLNLTFNDIDIKHIKNKYHSAYKIISTYPEFSDKVIMNISTNYDIKSHKIRNISEFGTKVVRDVFCRKYADTQRGNWLPNDILLLVIEIFSWIISYNIARLYNLTYMDQKVIAIILAMYYSQKCYADNNGKIVPIYRHIKRLGNSTEINSIEHKVLEEMGSEYELTVEDVVKLITTLNPDYIKDFNIQVFFRLGRAYHVDNMLSLISLEYPPYWLYSIMTAVSGENKSNMYWSLQKTGLLKEAKELTKKITRSVIFDSVFVSP